MYLDIISVSEDFVKILFKIQQAKFSTSVTAVAHKDCHQLLSRK